MLSQGSTAVVALGSLLRTRDAALHLESHGAPNISGPTFCVVRHDQHPMGRFVDLVAPNAVRPTHARITVPGPAPKYGAQTRDVLTEAGFSETDITTALASGAAAMAWSENYLPE
ncbi:MAG: hypothetical protein AAGF56_09260 [Pseudomonadota bacterium]